jgi:hypothetical protein
MYCQLFLLLQIACLLILLARQVEALAAAGGLVMPQAVTLSQTHLLPSLQRC